jgi:rare lipoprotein A
MICKPLRTTVRAFFLTIFASTLATLFFSTVAQAALVPVNQVSAQSQALGQAKVSSGAADPTVAADHLSAEPAPEWPSPIAAKANTPSLNLADSALSAAVAESNKAADFAQRLGEATADMQNQTLAGVEQAQKTLEGWQQKGMASWYGPGFHGRKTASGERFNTQELTAAHLTLPFGTKLLVRNERNGKEVIVRVNDRGPYAKSRIIDLSQAAARALGIDGLGRVIIQRLEGEAPRKSRRAD